MLRSSRSARAAHAATFALFGATAACSYGNYDGSYDGGPDSFLAQLDSGFAVDAAVSQTFPPNQDVTLTSGDGVFTVHVPSGAYTTSFTLGIVPHPYQGDMQTTAYEVTSLAGPPQKLVSAVYRIPNGTPSGNVALQQQSGGTAVFYAVQQGSPSVAALDTRSFGTFRLTFSQANPTVTSNPARCLTQCCGPSAIVALVNNQACGCTTNDAAVAAKCLEACPESLPQHQCAGSASPTCGGQVCTNTPCCVQSPNNPVCGAGCNSGVSMECTARTDCPQGEMCCLQSAPQNGPNSYTAQCMQSCPTNDQVCRQATDCTNGGSCMAPGAGSCPFQTCGKIAIAACP